MANEQNLRPSEYKFSHEDSVKGGKASVEARRKRKAMREAFEELLSKEYTNSQGQRMDGVTILCMKQFQNALDGDLRAFTEIRNTVGEMPVQQIELAQIPQEAYDRVQAMLEED